MRAPREKPLKPCLPVGRLHLGPLSGILCRPQKCGFSMKTNKSFTKRLRVTKKGKIISRVPGHNHFNAKESGTGRQRRRRQASTEMTSQDRSRFLPR